MTLVEAIIYGIVQGATEFLPISSTAHLRLVPELLRQPDPGASFTAVIQLGTVGSVLVYFFKDIVAVVRGAVESIRAGDRTRSEFKTVLAVVYATIPIMVLGFALKDLIEGPFRSLWVIAGSLIIMALVMLGVDRPDRAGRELDRVEPVDGVKVGLWQCLSLIPGMSRSGSSISGALFAGFSRPAAARLSFLMSLPAITMAGLYQGAKEFKSITGSELLMPTLVATVVSFGVGLACIRWLIGVLQKYGVRPFVWYRIGLGVLILIACAAGWVRPEAPQVKQPSSGARESRVSEEAFAGR